MFIQFQYGELPNTSAKSSNFFVVLILATGSSGSTAPPTLLTLSAQALHNMAHR